MEKITNKRICGGILGLLLLLMFYKQTVQIGADCPFWGACQIESESELREVKWFPAVQPDKCVDTATMYKGTQTKICIRSIAMDRHISGGILNNGAWEKDNVNLVLKGMDMYPKAVFLDIGSNIGMYTVLVAAASRKAVAVDALLEHLAYINQSLSVAGTSNYVRLLHHPVSDQVETLYPVTDNADNPGATRLVPAHLLGQRTKGVGPAVNTTTLQNVLKYVNSGTVIVKMDVEGFECKVLHPYLLHHHQSSSIFLPYILMEWKWIKANLDSNCPDMMGLVELLYNSRYEAFDLCNEKKIDREQTDWNSCKDILWAHTEAVKLI